MVEYDSGCTKIVREVTRLRAKYKYMIMRTNGPIDHHHTGYPTTWKYCTIYGIYGYTDVSVQKPKRAQISTRATGIK